MPEINAQQSLQFSLLLEGWWKDFAAVKKMGVIPRLMTMTMTMVKVIEWLITYHGSGDFGDGISACRSGFLEISTMYMENQICIYLDEYQWPV